MTGSEEIKELWRNTEDPDFHTAENKVNLIELPKLGHVIG
jgi:hypothetical protein